MDIVHVGLRRREPGPASPDEANETVGILWAHALPGDALQHITARSDTDRLDLLIYLRTRDPADARPPAVDAAHTLIRRGHQASPVLARRYFAPEPATD
ncbi:hypothetical protein [Kitasatospora griseola]|uniref:hypothetical protein n=1 Tax=Kitasatospora griseola TaxID=2064 RepID=UPI003436B779